MPRDFRSSSSALPIGYPSRFARLLALAVAILLFAANAPARPRAERWKATTLGGPPDPRSPLTRLGPQPLSFEPNRGQTAARVRFLFRGSSSLLFLTDREAVLRVPAGHGPERHGEAWMSNPRLALRPLSKPSLFSLPANPGPAHRAASAPRSPGQNAARGTASAEVTVRMRLLGTNPHPKVSGEQRLGGRANYLIGSERRRWQRNLPTFGRVRYTAVYPGIDLIYHGSNSPSPNGAQQLECDFQISPGADPGRIRLALRGAGEARLDARGALVLRVGAGTLRLPRPIIYQQVGGHRRPVSGGYARLSRRRGWVRVGFRLGDYDRRRPLVIDPVFDWVETFGGSETGGNLLLESAHGIAADADGNVYVTGWTNAADFPADNPLKALVPGQEGIYRVVAYVMKFDSSGTKVYSTLLGGQSPGMAARDYGLAVAVDAQQNAIVTGRTSSLDFPTTDNAYQRKKSNSDVDRDAFISQLDASGSALLYSTYLGSPTGEGHTEGTGVAVDRNGNFFVTGDTEQIPAPNQDYFGAFAAGFSSDGANRYFTVFTPADPTSFYGGYAVATDGQGNAYVAGLHAPSSGIGQAIVAKIGPAGGVEYLVSLAGAATTFGMGIGADGQGGCWVSCTTFAPDLPTSKDAFQPRYGGGNQWGGDAYVARLDGKGQLVYGSYLGGSGGDGVQTPHSLGHEPPPFSNMLAVDPSNGDVWLSGRTQSDDFPTVDPSQPRRHGGYDGFLTQFQNGKPIFSTYAAVEDNTLCNPSGLATDGQGDIFVVGSVVRAVQAANGSGTSKSAVMASLGKIRIDIKDTPDHSDDFACFHIGKGKGKGKPLPASITINKPEKSLTVKLTASPKGRVSISPPKLTLGPKTPKAKIQITPLAVSKDVDDVTITATASDGRQGRQRMTVVDVTFEMLDEKTKTEAAEAPPQWRAAPDPTRIGISTNEHVHVRHLRATVTPPKAAEFVDLDFGPHLDQRPAMARDEDGHIKFDPKGTAASTKKGDTYVRATLKSIECSVLRISVVVPGCIVRQEIAKEGVRVRDMNLDGTTSPSWVPPPPPGFIIEATVYDRDITVTVADQFGQGQKACKGSEPVGDIYTGAMITEDFHIKDKKPKPINQALKEDSTYHDPMGASFWNGSILRIPPVPVKGIPGPRIGDRFPLQIGQDHATFTVFVDEFPLQPNIERWMSTKPPMTVDIRTTP